MKRFICCLCLLALLITLCGCKDTEKEGIPDEKLTISQSDTSTDEASAYIDGAINILKEEVNAQGEPLYVPFGADPFKYNGSAIETIVTFSGDSHNPLQAKLFVLVDGILQKTTLKDGTTGYFHQFSFSANNNDEEIFTVPISFTPAFTEIKDNYDITFCVFLYNADRLYDPNILDLPRYTLDFDVSFMSINKELAITDKPLLSNEVMPSPTDAVLLEYPELSAKTSNYVNLSLSDDPSDDKEFMKRVSESDIINLYLYQDDGFEHQTMIFIDGEYYENFCKAGYFRWITEIDTVACVQIPAKDLGIGTHTIDIISYSLNEWGDSFDRFAVSVE